MVWEPLRLKILAGKSSDFKQPLTAVRRAGRKSAKTEGGHGAGARFLREDSEKDERENPDLVTARFRESGELII